MRRWPVQFFHDDEGARGDPSSSTLCCLANDGTVWRRIRSPTNMTHIVLEWWPAALSIPPLPQPGSPREALPDPRTWTPERRPDRWEPPTEGPLAGVKTPEAER